ncbi:hypothetical protein [Streptomyces sp. NE06-03C]|uniref:hypothetical protein n=1 Tax=Streptomyces sp. NE06-03C TaxID=3028694 RepID=UPI0029BC7EC1|nr:hypothetical protein [Streptomyces sp. NE06-03C]MDX2921835.1 hypothetical protein [Streptomyces sp. NE06-03C]
MSAHREPVPGRYYAESGPGWVTLDATPLVDNNVHDLLDLLAGDEFFERFMAVAAPLVTEGSDGTPDRLEFEQLKDDLVERLATRVRMTGQQARRIGARVYRLGVQVSAETDAATTPDVPAVSLAKPPAQRNRRAA